MAFVTLENFAAVQDEMLGVGTKMAGLAVLMLGFDYVKRIVEDKVGDKEEAKKEKGSYREEHGYTDDANYL